MSIKNKLAAGLLGGLSGGLVFGALMGMMGMLTTISSMFGVDSWAVGLVIHLMMSIAIGIGFVLVIGNVAFKSNGATVLWSMAYAVAWWVMGVLIAMPLMFGQALFALDSTTLLSLMGHVIYGLIMAFVAKKIITK